MSRPSEPLLAWLRDLIASRKLNTAAVANRAKLPRARVRKLLTGKVPMTVDELLMISQALDLSPSDMGVAMPSEMADSEGDTVVDDVADASDTLIDLLPDPEANRALYIDPFGNHHHQLFVVLFELGCDFAFLTETSQLVDSGIPAAVLEAHEGRPMLIRLQAAYHGYNNPRYEGDSVTLTLSFDALHECRFPWTSVVEVMVTPAGFDPGPDAEFSLDESADEPQEKKGSSHLRLV